MATQMLPKYSEFDCDGDGVGVRWTKWSSRLKNNLFVACKITDPAQKKATMLAVAGDGLNDIVDTLPEDKITPGENENVFDKLVSALNEYFNPKQNVEFQKYQFRRTMQLQDEPIDKYYARLSTLADTCAFASKDDEIKSQMISGARDDKVTQKGLGERDITLSQLLEYGKTLEVTKLQQKEMKSSAKGDRPVNAVSFHQQKHQPSGKAKQPKTLTPKERQHQNHKGVQCRNCGDQWPHQGGQGNCPARGAECSKCHKLHHYAAMCRSNGTIPKATHQQSYKGNKLKRKSYGKVHNVVTSRTNDSSSDIEYVYAVGNKHRENLPFADILINDKPVRALIDTGASVNIIDETTWNSLNIRQPLQASQTRLVPYGTQEELHILGQFNANLQHNSLKQVAVIYVVRGNSGCLLGYQSSQGLGIVNINTVRTTVPEEDSKSKEDIISQFPKLFQGIGQLKGVRVKLHIDESIQPVAHPHRRVPFHLRTKVEEKLHELEELDIIEKVEGPTPWVSPIVTPPKPNDPDNIRLCVDMRGPNKAISRERHITPTIDDILSDMNGAKLFSKLDLNQGYHQLLLAEESRYITTFSTHVGLRRYKRLNFGISCASEIFQNTVRNVLEGLEGVLNVSDDILVYAKDIREHKNRLHAVLDRLQDRGLTLNANKCSFCQRSLSYLGYRFSAEGISADPAKVQDIKEAPAPQNATEVRSILGLANYCARFIPNFATISAPLRNLTKKDEKWNWTEEHQQAFNKLKESLTSDRVMSYFDPKKNTEVLVDASPVGVAAILSQRDRDGSISIVSYASRALTDVESRYSQTEREALAIVFGCEKYHLYLYGSQFTVHTDHRPLITLFNNPHTKLPARIERWVLRLQQYNMRVEYKPGKDNPADYGSRHPQQNTSSSRAEKVAEEYINFIASNSAPNALTLKTIHEYCVKDKEIQSIIKAIQSNEWPEDLVAYQNVSHELSVTSDKSIVLRGTQIVLPEALRQKAIQLAHEGHQGLVKSKQLLRTKVWFPGIDKAVEKVIKCCIPCQANTLSHTREPLAMTSMPKNPWEQVDADFYGPLPSGDYLLVLIDAHSRFPVVEVLRHLTANSVIPIIDKVFATFGIPHIFKTDNGPPFNSYQFQQFAEHLGFHHHRITPRWPEANGEVERFMRSLGKAVRTSECNAVPWKQGLNAFLRSYRSSPHTTTKLAPASSLFGRDMNIKLPTISTYVSASKDMMIYDNMSKEKMKMYADKRRHTAASNIKVGDTVLIRQERNNKLTPAYIPKPYKVDKIKGSRITASCNGHTVTRNSSMMKLVPHDIGVGQTTEDHDDPADWCNPGHHIRGDATAITADNNVHPAVMEQDPPRAVIPDQVPVTVPDRPQRTKQQPGHLKDYVL